MAHGNRWDRERGEWQRSGRESDYGSERDWDERRREEPWERSQERGSWGSSRGARERYESEGSFEPRERGEYGGYEGGRGRRGEGEGYGGAQYERAYRGGPYESSDYERGYRGSMGATQGGSYAGGYTEARREDHRGKGPKGYKRGDERIREDVSEALKESPDVDATEVEVDVKDGEVTLRGEVRSRWEKRAAEDCVEDVPGVNDVKNELRIRSSQGSERGTSSSYGRTSTGAVSTNAGSTSSSQRSGAKIGSTNAGS